MKDYLDIEDTRNHKMKKKSFAPAIQLSGRTVTPKGYEWVLGFALAGCDWAVKKASEPEFLKMVRADLEHNTAARLDAEIKRYELRISQLKDELCGDA